MQNPLYQIEYMPSNIEFSFFFFESADSIKEICLGAQDYIVI